MNTLITASLIVLGITSIVLQWKKQTRFVDLVHVLLFSVTTLLLSTSSDEGNTTSLFLLLSLVAINFIAAQWSVLQKKFVRIVVPLISLGAYFFFLSGQTVVFMEEEYTLVNKFLVMGTVLALIASEIGVMKMAVLRKLFDGLSEEGIQKSILLLLLALAVFFGSFAAGTMGVYVIAAAFLMTSFYRKEDDNGLLTSLFPLVLFPLLLSLTSLTDINLANAAVLEGLLIGAFGVFFLVQLWMNSKANALILGAGYFIFFGISFGILFLGTIHNQMGGMDAFIGVLMGAAIVNLAIGKEYVGLGIFPILIAGGMLIAPTMVNTELQQFEEMNNSGQATNTDGGEDVQPTAISLDDAAGNYTLNPASSVVQFFLGKKGETKGAFTEVKGTINLAENMENSSLNIEMAMEHFTTFNKFRDESLRGADYFSADKFPTMNYKSTGFKSLGDNVYEVQGDFTMLGVTKNISVTLYRFEDDKLKLSGKGKIDRREFGMSPSATEGNIVTFEYTVELQK